MRLSMISAALVASLVGYGSTIALVLAAAQTLQATPAQAASWVMAISFAKAIGSLILSVHLRVPVVLAWSTGGAALIAAAEGVTIAQGAGAFIFAGVLTLLTGLIKPLGLLVSRIPDGIAGGMLAGILLPFCMAGAKVAGVEPLIVLPMVLAFALVRLANPAHAVIAAMFLGILLAFGLGKAQSPDLSLKLASLVFIAPEWDFGVIIGLGLPIYLVTMASQNLPGFATQRSAGYESHVAPSLAVTGGLSTIIGFFGSHSVSMAAITAAICMGPDVHPDKNERWKVAFPYALFWFGFGIFSPMLLGLLTALPPAFMTALVALALIGTLTGALSTALAQAPQRFAAVLTCVVTASGLSIVGIGAAFWGLMLGLGFYGLERLWAARRPKN